MLLGLVLLIPPNPEKSLEAVSVYEGLRLERLAQVRVRVRVRVRP